MRPIHLFTLLGLAPALLHAQVLVTWDFESASPGTQGTIVSSALVASVGNATSVGATGGRQSGGTIFNLPAGGDSGVGLDYIAPYAAGTAATNIYNVNGFGTAPSASSYVSFGLTMASTLDPTALQGISFDFATSGTSGPRGVQVTYRIGTTGSFTILGTTAVPNNIAGNYGRFSFNLGSPATLAANDVVEFRLLGYANFTDNSIRLDNVSITAIPEPSTYALIACGLASLVWLRRRNR